MTWEAGGRMSGCITMATTWEAGGRMSWCITMAMTWEAGGGVRHPLSVMGGFAMWYRFNSKVVAAAAAGEEDVVEILQCGSCNMTYFANEEILYYFRTAKKKLELIARTTLPYLVKKPHCHILCTIWHNNETFAYIFFLVNILTSLSALKTTSVVSYDLTIFTRWRPESISVHIARHAISLYIDVRVTSCRGNTLYMQRCIKTIRKVILITQLFFTCFISVSHQAHVYIYIFYFRFCSPNAD